MHRNLNTYILSLSRARLLLWLPKFSDGNIDWIAAEELRQLAPRSLFCRSGGVALPDDSVWSMTESNR